MAYPAITSTPQRGAQQSSAMAWRNRLDSREAQAGRLVGAYYREASVAILKEVGKYARAYETAVAQGKPISPSWMFQAERLTNLLASVEMAAGRFSGSAADAIQETAEEAARMGDAAARALSAPPTDLARALGSVGWSAWSSVPQDALAAITGAVGTDSPLSSLLMDTMPRDLGYAIRDQLIHGMAAGWGTNRMLRNLRETIQAGTLNRARTILRTETHRAYREASHEGMMRNADTLQGWVWLSASDATTCAFCWGQQGTIHPVHERMHSHPNCRCTMVPRTEAWATIAVKAGVRDTDVLKGLLDVESPAPIPLGEPTFRNLPEGTQRSILGRARFDAFQEGKYGLRDFYEWKDSALWGSTPRLIPLGRLGLGRQRPGVVKPPDSPGGGAAPAPARVLDAGTPPWDFGSLDEAEAWMVARFPHAKVTMEKEYLATVTTYDPVTNLRTGTRQEPRPLNLEMVHPTLHELDRLARAYPEVMANIKQLGFVDFHESNVYAHANADLIEWNTGMFSRATRADLGPNRSMMTSDFVERGANREAFHPAGIPEDRWIASVTTHEFGHSVAFWSRYRSQGAAWSDVVSSTGFGRLDNTMYSFFSKVKMTGGAVSGYARKSEEERWAEAFSAVHFQPRDRWKPYTKKVAAVMETMFGAGVKRVAQANQRLVDLDAWHVANVQGSWNVVTRVNGSLDTVFRAPFDAADPDGYGASRRAAIAFRDQERKKAREALGKELDGLRKKAKEMGLDPEDLGL